MAVVAQPTPPSDPPEYTFTVEQYHRMIDAKILTEEDRIEFVEGVLVPKMTRKPPHDSTLDCLEDAIRALLPAQWRLRSQKAIALSNGEPEPDVAVVRGPARRYDDHHPTPAEIALVAEVADSSLDIDRGRKLTTYARHGLAVYWVVNLIDRRVEVYTDPETPRRGKPRYRTRTDYLPDQALPVVIASKTVGSIAVSAVLPPA